MDREHAPITPERSQNKGRKKPYDGAPTYRCATCGHEWQPVKPLVLRRAPLRCPNIKCQVYLYPPPPDKDEPPLEMKPGVGHGEG